MKNNAPHTMLHPTLDCTALEGSCHATTVRKLFPSYPAAAAGLGQDNLC